MFNNEESTTLTPDTTTSETTETGFTYSPETYTAGETVETTEGPATVEGEGTTTEATQSEDTATGNLDSEVQKVEAMFEDLLSRLDAEISARTSAGELPGHFVPLSEEAQALGITFMQEANAAFGTRPTFYETSLAAQLLVTIKLAKIAVKRIAQGRLEVALKDRAVGNNLNDYLLRGIGYGDEQPYSDFLTILSYHIQGEPTSTGR